MQLQAEVWIDDQQTGEHAGPRCHCPETWVQGTAAHARDKKKKKKARFIDRISFHISISHHVDHILPYRLLSM